MSEYVCIRCNKKLMLNTTTRTLDGKDVCFEDYKTTANELCKGLFTSEELFKVFEGHKSQITIRNGALRTMLQATILDKKSAGHMIQIFNKEFKKRIKELYNKKEEDLLPREKTSVVQLIYGDYRRLFGDYSTTKCNTIATRDIKGRYYEWLEEFNNDIDIKVLEDTTSDTSEECIFTS